MVYTGAAEVEGLARVLKMLSHRRWLCLVLPIALFAVLLGTTAGVVFHHHAGAAADNCPICHLSHQTVVPAVAHVGNCQLAQTGAGPEPQAGHLVDDSVPRDVPARGPPV
ncbi:hypothetical protein GCM10011507_33670 [Edaphobacter acidisoli]|uniref:Uncharacterized protein n=1 Tax=Edaphobacter acidisoli TaxID=2040573 RepID=A0A916S3L4_9BACT|nr:hypothetical protein GCM10011507_33670 [Edaphobacter acidisoli]